MFTTGIQIEIKVEIELLLLPGAIAFQSTL